MIHVAFDDTKHTYLVAGKPYPSATTVLEDSGYAEQGEKFYTRESRHRGNAVHQVRYLADMHAPDKLTLGDALDGIPYTIDERLLPYLAGYLLFKRETGFRAYMSEVAIASTQLRIAGKMDIWGTYPDGTKVLVDTKGWQNHTNLAKPPKRGAVLQTAIYKILAKESLGLETDIRVVLNLPGNGEYRKFELKCIDHERDEAIVYNIATVWWDRYDAKLVKIRGEEE